MSETQTTNKDLFSVGAHFGYSKSRRHPSTAPYIYATNKGNDVIDLERTQELLDTAKAYIAELAREGKQILFVGTKPEARSVVQAAAEAINQPYVVNRWVGGILTNFSEIKKRINHLTKLTEDQEKGELEKYTKKEQLLFTQEIERMTMLFAGLLPLKGLPDALFVVDTRTEDIAVREAQKRGIPVISLSNTDCNIEPIDYPVVANDSAISSIEYIVTDIKDTYEAHVRVQEPTSEEKTQTNS